LEQGYVGAEKAIVIKEEPTGENKAFAIGIREELHVGGATNKKTATAKETTDEAEETLGAGLHQVYLKKTRSYKNPLGLELKPFFEKGFLLSARKIHKWKSQLRPPELMP